MCKWNADISKAPDCCVGIISMGVCPKTGRHYDVVSEIRRDDNGEWSGNAMSDIGGRLRAWAPLPKWFDSSDGPRPSYIGEPIHHGSGRKVEL